MDEDGELTDEIYAYHYEDNGKDDWWDDRNPNLASYGMVGLYCKKKVARFHRVVC